MKMNSKDSPLNSKNHMDTMKDSTDTNSSKQTWTSSKLKTHYMIQVTQPSS